MPAARRTIEIDAPAERVMEVITDFGGYPRFLPDMRAVEVLESGADRWVVRFTLHVIRDLIYTLELVRRDPLHLSWSQVEGAFRVNEGGWVLEPLDEGRRTRATYALDVRVGMFVPGSIVRSLLDESLPDTLARFKVEAERRG